METSSFDLRMHFIRWNRPVLGNLADVQHFSCTVGESGSHDHPAVDALASEGNVWEVNQNLCNKYYNFTVERIWKENN